MVFGLYKTNLLGFFCAVQVQHRKVTQVFPSDFNGSDYFINIINTTIYRSNFSILVEVFRKQVHKYIFTVC